MPGKNQIRNGDGSRTRQCKAPKLLYACVKWQGGEAGRDERLLDLVDRGCAADRRRARHRNLLSVGVRHCRRFGQRRGLARGWRARAVCRGRRARRRVDDCFSPLAARARDTSAVAVIRCWAVSPRADVERGRQRARRLPRLRLERRARGPRCAARRNDVHRRDARLRARAVRPETRAMSAGRLEAFTMWLGSSLFTVALFVVALIVIAKAIRVVPQQHALVIERLGRFYAVLQPGLNFVIPFVDRVAYTHDLREIPFDVPSQICITKDNTQLQVDGILYFQVTDPKL